MLALALVLACCLPATAEAAQGKSLRIIATSDLHGKFVPWDYALNAESTSGSVAQLATAIAQYRTDSTLLVDAGDTIQDNSADIFVGADDIHPMVQALNALNYDVWVTGNHEYNYGMDITKKTIADMKCKVLTGNVYDENGEAIADDCAIFDVDGVRVAVIGMVTPNITRWDSVNLAKCKVTDPLEETRGIIDAMQGRYDVLVGVYHMGIKNEYGVENSGVTDMLNACPEFDVMVSSHEHALIDLINNVQMYYTGAPVSAAALFVMDANMYPGDIHKCDMALVYKYTNTLYRLRMTGAQLKKYMEWSAEYYQTYAPGDLTIAFNPDVRAYNYDMFEGVNYDVNIANEPGSRIENLTWPDGTPVKDDDTFDIAVNNYRATSHLLAPARSSGRTTCPSCWRRTYAATSAAYAS